MDYEKLLAKAKADMPPIVQEKQRFEIPPIKGHVQGSRTVLDNLPQIANHIHRPVDHLVKYLLKELATPGELQGNGMAILGRKVSSSEVNGKIKQYADEFLFCPQCGKPDTEFLKEGELTFVKCMVCGSKNVVKTRI